MPFKKGEPRPAKAGRKPGQPNKLSGEIKAQMMGCFNLKKFKTWADTNPDAFYALIGKILPKDIEAQGLIKLVIMDCLKDNVD